MAREIMEKLDALFVEGSDDMAVVNALVRRSLGVDIARLKLIKRSEEGGGHAWALGQFRDRIREGREEARIGVIVDRDSPTNDRWPHIQARLAELGLDLEAPDSTGTIVAGRYGAWMWPDNVHYGDLETFVAGVVPQSGLLAYSAEASRVAKESHGAEYEAADARKAALKVRSIWRDASAADGHLVRNLDLLETPASVAFIAWFRALFLSNPPSRLATP